MNNSGLIFPSDKGIYILFFFLSKDKRITVGKLGRFEFKSGYYIYVGSAKGRGGINGRLKHHLNLHSPLRWHIDYLKMKSKIIDYIFITEAEANECITATKLLKDFETPIKNFGSSDCKCNSHLFYSQKRIPTRIIKSILITN